MMSPASVLEGKASDNELAEPEATLAASCTGEALLVAEIVSERMELPVPPELEAVRVTVEVPAVEGVPEISPVLVLTERPEGNPVAPKLVGELVPVI